MHLSLSQDETTQFGYQIYRAQSESPISTAQLTEAIANHNIDILVLRLEINQCLSLLNSLANSLPMHLADSLIEYCKPISKHTMSDFLHSGATIRYASDSDKEVLEAIIRNSYQAYENHYHTNQFIDSQKILPGIVKWVFSFIGNKRANKEQQSEVLIMRLGEIDCGFLVVESNHGIGSTLIGGVTDQVSPVSRHKILADATHHADQMLIQWGCKRFAVKTRTDKQYIQKLLVKHMHTSPTFTWGTLHIHLFKQCLSKQPTATIGHINQLPIELNKLLARPLQAYQLFAIDRDLMQRKNLSLQYKLIKSEKARAYDYIALNLKHNEKFVAIGSAQITPD